MGRRADGDLGRLLARVRPAPAPRSAGIPAPRSRIWRRPGRDRARALLADRAPRTDVDAQLPSASERDARGLGPAAAPAGTQRADDPSGRLARVGRTARL